MHDRRAKCLITIKAKELYNRKIDMINKQKTSTNKIKKLVFESGADLCGIAPVERFKNAPAGFRPTDIYSKARAVIVYAKRVPGEVLYAESCIPYTHVNSLMAAELDKLSLKLSLQLQDVGVNTVMIPSDDPYESWNQKKRHGQAILSLRHAGELAGLGRLGRNNLLINVKYGNMIQLGALLTDSELNYDELVDYQVCPSHCSKCIRACPKNALDGTTVVQGTCRTLATYKNEKGYVLKKCWECRKVCPHALGLKISNG